MPEQKDGRPTPARDDADDDAPEPDDSKMYPANRSRPSAERKCRNR
jgi:hypothetical protein